MCTNIRLKILRDCDSFCRLENVDFNIFSLTSYEFMLDIFIYDKDQ